MTRKFTTFFRIVKYGFISFFRNAWLAIAAMAIMVVTLTIVLFSIITNETFNNTIAQITDRIDVSVYLQDDITVGQRDKLLSDLKRLDNVKSLTYLSKDDALARYKKQNAGNAALQEAISQTDNPLPATILIKPRELSKIVDIKDFLNTAEKKTMVADVSYRDDRKDAIDKIAHATNILQRVGVGAVIIFAFISMLIIFNTIQMAIFNRRDELTIMRLLGAGTWFIRGPFVVETIMYGVLSALISVALIHAVFVAASSTLEATSLGLLDINYASEFFYAHFWQLLTMQLMVGILIGAASSIIATKRYLKFKTTK